MVNIDTVYQKVLAIANKEQRGYITPQEFNLFADYAQKDIFEKYFYDINQFSRVPGNNTEYSDAINSLEEKISNFKRRSTLTHIGNQQFRLPDDYYRLGTLSYRNNEIESVNSKDLLYLQSTQLLKPTAKRPVYIRYENTAGTDRIEVFPKDLDGGTTVVVNYVKKPEKPNWSGVEVNNNFLYNETASTNFELHAEEENLLIVKILQLAGISMKDFGLAQAAGQKEVNDINNEKS
jgi:hypothetical protein